MQRGHASWDLSWDGWTIRISLKDSLEGMSWEKHGPGIVVVRLGRPTAPEGMTSTFSLESKTYTKRGTPWEVKFMRYLLYSRARFYPEAES